MSFSPAFDYSTLDMEKIEKLPKIKLAPSYHFQREPGNGCYLDPPGYPSYFTRSIYTLHGNQPSRGDVMELVGHSVEKADWVDSLTLFGRVITFKRPENLDWEAFIELRQKFFNSIYKPLPFEHPRVQEWVKDLWMHFRHCYVDDSKKRNERDRTVIFPTPSYRLKTPHIDARWKEEYIEAAKREAEEWNKMVIERDAIIAKPENHQAVRHIREFYPEYQPPAEWLDPAFRMEAHPGDWWERHATQPTPEECAATSDAKGRRDYLRHREGWCQFCGHVTPKKGAAVNA